MVGRRRAAPRPRIAAVIAGAVLIAAIVVTAVTMVDGDPGPVAAGSTGSLSPTPSASDPTPSVTDPAPTVTGPVALVPHAGNTVTGPSSWWSWALLDRRTGDTWGGPTADEPTRSVSMIKFWLAALYLREHPEPSQGMLNQLSTMIRDSNNDVADSVFFGLGGRGPVISAMESVCGVTGPYILPGYWWASTWISSRDATRLGDCVASGRVAGARWTAWVMDEMRQVRGAGDFGIRFAFPQAQRGSIAIKNGWNIEDGVWYVNCLAIGDTWVLATESRAGSFVTGRDVCVGVATQLLQQPQGPLDIWSALP